MEDWATAVIMRSETAPKSSREGAPPAVTVDSFLVRRLGLGDDVHHLREREGCDGDGESSSTLFFLDHVYFIKSMKLEEILLLNVSEIPKTASSFTAAELQEELDLSSRYTAGAFAAGPGLFQKIDLAARSQAQHDQLSLLTGRFLQRVESLFARQTPQ